MKSICHIETKEQIIDRLNKFDSQKQPLWGQFTCQKMLSHLADSLRMALGHLTVAAKKTPVRYWPINLLLVYWMPIPKGIPTSPELIARAGDAIDKEIDSIINLLNEFADRKDEKNWPYHPAFGKLSKSAWGVLLYKHVDHHLKQFGT